MLYERLKDTPAGQVVMFWLAEVGFWGGLIMVVTPEMMGWYPLYGFIDRFIIMEPWYFIGFAMIYCGWFYGVLARGRLSDEPMSVRWYAHVESHDQLVDVRRDALGLGRWDHLPPLGSEEASDEDS